MKKTFVLFAFALLCTLNISIISNGNDKQTISLSIVHEANANTFLFQSQFGCADLDCNNPHGECPNYGGEIGPCLIGCNGGAWLYCDGCPSCPGEG